MTFIKKTICFFLTIGCAEILLSSVVFGADCPRPGEEGQYDPRLFGDLMGLGNLSRSNPNDPVNTLFSAPWANSKMMPYGFEELRSRLNDRLRNVSLKGKQAVLLQELAGIDADLVRANPALQKDYPELNEKHVRGLERLLFVAAHETFRIREFAAWALGYRTQGPSNQVFQDMTDLELLTLKENLNAMTLQELIPLYELLSRYPHYPVYVNSINPVPVRKVLQEIFKLKNANQYVFKATEDAGMTLQAFIKGTLKAGNELNEPFLAYFNQSLSSIYEKDKPLDVRSLAQAVLAAQAFDEFDDSESARKKIEEVRGLNISYQEKVKRYQELLVEGRKKTTDLENRIAREVGVSGDALKGFTVSELEVIDDLSKRYALTDPMPLPGESSSTTTLHDWVVSTSAMKEKDDWVGFRTNVAKLKALHKAYADMMAEFEKVFPKEKFPLRTKFFARAKLDDLIKEYQDVVVPAITVLRSEMTSILAHNTFSGWAVRGMGGEYFKVIREQVGKALDTDYDYEKDEEVPVSGNIDRILTEEEEQLKKENLQRVAAAIAKGQYKPEMFPRIDVKDKSKWTTDYLYRVAAEVKTQGILRNRLAYEQLGLPDELNVKQSSIVDESGSRIAVKKAPPVLKSYIGGAFSDFFADSQQLPIKPRDFLQEVTSDPNWLKQMKAYYQTIQQKSEDLAKIIQQCQTALKTCPTGTTQAAGVSPEDQLQFIQAHVGKNRDILKKYIKVLYNKRDAAEKEQLLDVIILPLLPGKQSEMQKLAAAAVQTKEKNLIWPLTKSRQEVPDSSYEKAFKEFVRSVYSPENADKIIKTLSEHGRVAKRIEGDYRTGTPASEVVVVEALDSERANALQREFVGFLLQGDTAIGKDVVMDMLSKYEMLEATADRFGINLKKVAFNDKSKKFMADIEDKRNKWTEEERSYTEIYQAMKAPLADGGRRTSWQATKDAGKMIPGILWGAFVEPVVDAGMLVALPFVEEFGGDKAAYAYMNAVGGELKIDPVTGQQWVDQNGVLKFFNDYLHTRSVLDPSLSGWEGNARVAVDSVIVAGPLFKLLRGTVRAGVKVARGAEAAKTAEKGAGELFTGTARNLDAFAVQQAQREAFAAVAGTKGIGGTLPSRIWMQAKPALRTTGRLARSSAGFAGVQSAVEYWALPEQRVDAQTLSEKVGIFANSFTANFIQTFLTFGILHATPSLIGKTPMIGMWAEPKFKYLWHTGFAYDMSRKVAVEAAGITEKLKKDMENSLEDQGKNVLQAFKDSWWGDPNLRQRAVGFMFTAYFWSGAFKGYVVPGTPRQMAPRDSGILGKASAGVKNSSFWFGPTDPLKRGAPVDDVRNSMMSGLDMTGQSPETLRRMTVGEPLTMRRGLRRVLLEPPPTLGTQASAALELMKTAPPEVREDARRLVMAEYRKGLETYLRQIHRYSRQNMEQGTRLFSKQLRLVDLGMIRPTPGTPEYIEKARLESELSTELGGPGIEETGPPLEGVGPQ